MALVIRTSGILEVLRKIITNANNKLIIMSPFLNLKPEFKVHIETQNKRKTDILFISKKEQLDKNEEWFEQFKFSNCFFTITCNDLHGKCYLNENEALLTSMNFSDYSGRNNEEIGIHVSKDDDEKLYDDISKVVHEIIKENVCSEIDTKFSFPFMGSTGCMVGFCTICGSVLYDELYYTIDDDCKNFIQRYCCKFCHDIIQKVGFNAKNYRGFYCVDCGKLITISPSVPLCTEHFNGYLEFLKNH